MEPDYAGQVGELRFAHHHRQLNHRLAAPEHALGKRPIVRAEDATQAAGAAGPAVAIEAEVDRYAFESIAIVLVGQVRGRLSVSTHTTDNGAFHHLIFDVDTGTGDGERVAHEFEVLARERAEGQERQSDGQSGLEGGGHEKNSWWELGARKPRPSRENHVDHILYTFFASLSTTSPMNNGGQPKRFEK